METLDYAVTTASECAAWTVEEVLGGRWFDASGPIVPEPWVGVAALDFLDAAERRVLNHCRAFSYVHLLGSYEEFIPRFLDAGTAIGARRDGLTRFSDEERKHQALFRRTERLLEDACDLPFGRWFEAGSGRLEPFITEMIAPPPLATFLALLALEWGTQRHYVDSVRDGAADPLYAAVLRAHWIEEAQHTRWDTLEILRLARAAGPRGIRAAFEHLPRIGMLIEPSFAGQVTREMKTLRETTGRRLSAAEHQTLHAALVQSLRGIIADVSFSHPRFRDVAVSLSPEGAASIGLG